MNRFSLCFCFAYRFPVRNIYSWLYFSRNQTVNHRKAEKQYENSIQFTQFIWWKIWISFSGDIKRMKCYRRFWKANWNGIGQLSRMLCFVRKLRQQNVLHLKETKSVVEHVPSFYLGYHFNINIVNNIFQWDGNMFFDENYWKMLL